MGDSALDVSIPFFAIIKEKLVSGWEFEEEMMDVHSSIRPTQHPHSVVPAAAMIMNLGGGGGNPTAPRVACVWLLNGPRHMALLSFP